MRATALAFASVSSKSGSSARGREDRQAGCGVEQACDVREGVGQVLEVVEHEQRWALGERIPQRLELAAGDIAEVERRGDGGEEERRVGKRREVDEDGAVPLGGDGERQSGLPAAAGAGERN